MNILKPAELGRNDLLRLANALAKHGVTEIAVDRGDEIQHLRAAKSCKWQVTQSVGSTFKRKRSVTIPLNFNWLNGAAAMSPLSLSFQFVERKGGTRSLIFRKRNEGARHAPRSFASERYKAQYSPKTERAPLGDRCSSEQKFCGEQHVLIGQQTKRNIHPFSIRDGTYG